MEGTGKSSFGIIQIAAVLGSTLMIGLWQHEFVSRFLVGSEAPLVGRVVNLIVIGVFSLGTMKVRSALIANAKEERQLRQFAKNMGSGSDDLLQGVSHDSLIGRRYHTISSLYERNGAINQNVLAYALRNELSSRASWPKYVSSVLILLGMLGTILALALALLGASDLFKSLENARDMSIIINSMSTALSTTLTAIVCYVLFRFFLEKLISVQRSLATGIEQVTMLHIIPKLGPRPEALNQNFAGLLAQLEGLLQQLSKQQAHLDEREGRLARSGDQYQDGLERVVAGMTHIQNCLKQGFRI